MMTYYEPEVGQAVFGQPWGEYECPEYIEALLEHLAYEIERVEYNKGNTDYGAPTHNNGEKYSTDVFDMQAYYWGECTCGYDKLEMEWEEQNKHTDDCFYTRYQKEEEECCPPFGFNGDVWQWKRNHMIEWSKRNGCDKAPYGMAVYCDCAYDRKWDEFLSHNDHKPDCLAILPNFKCGDIEIRWYKYLGRGMSINKQITEKEAREMFDKCLKSVRALEEDGKNKNN